MGTVTNINEHLPHVVLDTTKYGGSVVVVPVAYFQDYLAGKAVAPLTEEELKTIVEDWLGTLESGDA